MSSHNNDLPEEEGTAHTSSASSDSSDQEQQPRGGATRAVRRVLVGNLDIYGRQNFAPGEVKPPKANWPVFIISALGIVAIAVWAAVAPENADSVLGTITTWISTNLGWFYILTGTVCVVFILAVAFSRSGTLRLGPDHSRPQFRLFSWSAMLFSAGIGVDLMFFSVAEPVTQYLAPPDIAPQTKEAAEQAVVWALFHYGFTGWAMYSLLGMAFGYYAYRLNMPLAIRSALYPLIGKRIHGPIGDAVDIAAVLGTIFGIAASLGIGVVQLNYGLTVIFGWDESLAVQAALVIVGVGAATLSSVSGVDKGIKRLSEFNVFVAISLVVYVVVTGKTAFLLDAFIMNIGDYVSSFPSMTMDTFAFSDDPEATKAWMGAWTLFFWAWWVAWAPFVGLFLARISRGRTLRQFVIGTMTIPFLFILCWMSFFGNTALDRVRSGDTAFAEATAARPEQGFYDLLSDLPAGTALIIIATLFGLLKYITSADSGALVTANFTSRIEDSQQDGPRWSRIFWAVLVGILTLVMLQIGGVSTVQSATIVMGLPFSLVMYLIMLGLWRSLRLENLTNEARAISIHGAMSGRSGAQTDKESWRKRLNRATSWPTAEQANKYLSEVGEPALKSVASELKAKGIEANLVESTVAGLPVHQLDLYVPMKSEQDFRYQIYPVANTVPEFSRKPGNPETYYRLEVFDRTGSLGFDVYGYTTEQLIDNVLDLYERHLEFLHMQQDLPGSSDLSDGADPVSNWD